MEKKSKAIVLAPVISDAGEIITSGVIEMDDERAMEYDRDGLLDVFERNGASVGWTGCCSHNS